MLARVDRRIRRFVVIGVGLVLATAGAAACVRQAAPPGSVTVSYQASSEDFPNPERGFTENQLPPSPAHPAWDSCGQGNNFTAYNDTAWTPALRVQDLTAARAAGRSLVYVRYHIAAFRDAPLSDAFLARVDQDFATARTTGVKIVPRFAYNFGTGGPDAPLQRVLGHLDQLQPVLHRNADVLAFMELGFIGCWGEGHTSSNNLVGPEGLNDATRSILDKAFAVVPAERMIAVRYPYLKFQYFGSNEAIAPLTDAQAFDGSTRARWGEHDDCLTCGEFNWGTWATPAHDAPAVRAFLHDDNRYVVQDGEPGEPGPPQPPDGDQDGYTDNYDACPRVLGIFEQEHWSAIDGYAATAARRWQRDGCYGTIATHLGYRFRLEHATVPLVARRGRAFAVQMTLSNDGWAAPYNARPVEVVLRDHRTGALTRIPVTADPRRWQPGTTTLNLTPVVPSGLRPGRYDVLLALPDAAPSIHDRPDYAVRFANQGTWDAACGCNALGAHVVVTGSGSTGR